MSQNNLHRPFRLLGEKVADRQLARAALAAEVGADVDRLNANLARRNAGRFGKLPARAERTFGRSPSMNLAVIIDLDEKRLRLEISLMMDRHTKGVFQY